VEHVEIPAIEKEKIQHVLNSNGKSLTLTIEFFTPSDCNEMVRFLTNVIDEMTNKE